MTLHYSAYGLCIASEVKLLGLPHADRESADVVIRYAPVPVVEGLADDLMYETAPGEFVLKIDGVARYQVLGGKEIRVDPFPGVPDEDVLLYLLGSTWGALLHQRNILALHASCVQTSAGAVLFVGESGIGKSTLAAALSVRGLPILADDVTGITLNRHTRPMAWPAFPHLRLWTDSAAELHLESQGRRRVFHDCEKYYHPAPAFCEDPQPVCRLYELTASDTEQIRIEQLDALQAFELLATQTYRSHFLDDLSERRSHFHLVREVVQRTTARRVIRPQSGFQLDALVDAILDDLGEQPLMTNVTAASSRPT